MAFSSIAPRSLTSVLLVAGWIVLVVAGMGVAARYESRPGTAASPPHSAAGVTGELATLLVFAHPQCPCTRATLEELDHIAARVGELVRIEVLVYSDPNADEAWTHGGIWKRAANIPGVEVHADPRGERARALGVATSGETLLFAPDGRLLYHGGITSARGHVGDNAGADIVVEAVRGRTTAPSSMPVFGCSLFNPGVPEEETP
jgi:hypothetical protein